MLLKQLALLAGGLVGLSAAIPRLNVLVLSEFDITGVENQVLRNNGFNVTGVTTSQFQSLTPQDFGTYNAIFISDAGVCDPNTQLGFLDTATSEKLARVVSGRIELIGTSLAGERAMRLAINASADLTDVGNFVLDAAYRLSARPAVGLYLSLGCYYSNVFGNPATVPALSGFGTFSMRAPHQSPPSGCVSSDATYRGGAQPVIFPSVTEAQLRAWQCAAREVFIDRPDTNSSGFDWIITSANAETPNPAPPGAPFVLGREMVAPACGNGWIDRAFNEECDFSTQFNGLNNSNCDANCQCLNGLDSNGNCIPIPNVCGNGVVDTNSTNIPTGIEQCDLGIQFNGQPGSTCDANCQCIYGVSANNSCVAAPVSSTATTTTTSPTATTTTTTTSSTSTTTSGSSTSSASTSSAASQSSTVTSTSTRSSSTGSLSTGGTSSGTVPPTSAQSSSTVVQSSSTGTQSSSPSSSVDPLPPRIGQFVFKACTGSVQNYPSFELQFSSNQMTLEMCIAGCAGSLYSGTHVNDCYCANAYDSVVEVARDRCSIPCPGNALENCGGYRGNSTDLLRRYDTRRQSTGSVPANALLAIYEYSPLATSSSPATTGPTTAAPVPAAQSTSTGTTVVTAVATVTATPNGGGSCATGFCNAAGYFFELCEGGPLPGEAVFVIEACSCAGGFRYVPAGCSGAGCGSLVVYRAVPWTGGDNGTVYQPQACSSTSGCAGSVVFQQNPVTPTANTTGVVVVVAGAGKLVGYLGSAMVVGGSLLLAALL